MAFTQPSLIHQLSMFYEKVTDTIKTVESNEIYDISGYTLSALSVWTIFVDWLTSMNVNNVFQCIVLVLTTLFLFFKVYNAYLDSQGKRLDNKLKEHNITELIDKEKFQPRQRIFKLSSKKPKAKNK